MNLEQDIQKRFIKNITSDNLNHISSALKVYSDLVYYSFLEVIEKAYPRCCKLFDQKSLKDIIYKFMDYGSYNPLYWRVALEFRDFILKYNTYDIDFLDDLISYEALEIQMYMQKYTDYKESKFDLKNSYKLNPQTNISIYNYPIHNPSFDQSPNSFEKGEYIVLFYFDKDKLEIISQEITPFLKEFLESLDSLCNIEEVMEIFSSKYEVPFEDIKEILEDVLSNYLKLNVLIKA